MSDVDIRRLRKKAVLVGGPSRKDMEQICGVLNSEHKKEAVELRHLVSAWFASGPNLKKMLYADHDLWGKVQESWKSIYLPTRTGRAHIALFPKSSKNEETAVDEACALFAMLTLNPECHMLAGPCPRCDSYFLKRSLRQKVYCSQRCGSAATALPAVQKKRAAEHAKKLQLVERELRNMKSMTEPKKWKHSLSRRTGLTVRWLSRALNRGEFAAPAERR